MNRARHFPTVCLARPISPATTVLVLPSEQRRMIRDRRASAWAVVGRRFQRSRALAFVGGKVQGREWGVRWPW